MTTTLLPDAGESRTSSVIAAAVVSIIISGIFYAGRLVAKRVQRQWLKASDYVLLVGLCCCWGFCALNIWYTHLGLGTHLDVLKEQDPTYANIKLLLKVFLVEEVFYDVGIASIKISILLFYRELFPGRWFRLAVYIMMGIVSAWCIGNLLPSLFSCRPIEGFWEFDMQPPPVCINKQQFYISSSTINVVTDMAILALPTTRLAKLQMPMRIKMGVIAAFLLGGLVCIVSIYRFTVLTGSDSADLTWDFAPVLNWSVVELATGIASASLPTMRPLLRFIVPRRWHSSWSGNGGRKSGISGGDVGGSASGTGRSRRLPEPHDYQMLAPTGLPARPERVMITAGAQRRSHDETERGDFDWTLPDDSSQAIFVMQTFDVADERQHP